MPQITLPTTADTEGFGRALAAELSAGDLVILAGPLGAGKTALARGIAAGLDDLPLFAAVQAEAPPPDPLRSELAAVDVDALTPRSALELLYKLKALAAD